MSIHWWPGEFLKDNRAFIDAINLRMGYRLMPVSVTWPQSVPIATQQDAYTTYGDVSGRSDHNKCFKVQWSWVNKGVAPCYPGGYPTLTIKDDKDGIVSVLVDETLNLRDLKMGEPAKAPAAERESEFIIGLFSPATRPGTYDLYISVGIPDGTPTIELPLEGGDGQRRYKIGSITLREVN